MAGSTQKVFSTIGAMQTFIENFPMSILSLLKGKKYSSVIEFIIDLLLYLGIDMDTVVDRILQKVFENTKDNEKVKDAKEKLDKIKNIINNVKYNMNEEVMFERIGELELESEFITRAEDAIKIGLAELLAALLSCNCIPVIPDDKMDNISSKASKGFMSIPVNTFDMFNKLSICPTTSTGTCYYQMDTEYTYKEIPEYAIPSKEKDNVVVVSSLPEENDSSPVYCKLGERYFKKTKKSALNMGNLYQTDDLDAFIWYVLNRGTSDPQIEENKMMWDSRLSVKSSTARSKMRSSSDGDSDTEADVYAPPRTTGEEWQFWLKSKTGETGEFYYKGQKDEEGNEGYNKNSSLFPIMQLEPETMLVDEKRLRVYISSQRYYLKGNYKDKNKTKGEAENEANGVPNAGEMIVNSIVPNHTMYKFNYDYVKNIKLFSTKQILASLVKFLYGGNLNGIINVGFGITQSKLEAQLRNVINNIIESDDMSVENCYFTFSNEDFDNMLYQNDLDKYNAISRGYASPEVRTTNIGDVFDTINGSYSTTSAGETNVIKKTVQDLTVVDAADASTTYGVTMNVGLNGMSLLETLIMGLIYPFAEALLSPKVLLLVVINLDVAGIINLKELSYKDKDFIVDFLWKKMFALLSSLIIIIKDLIVELLIDLFSQYVQPIISAFMATILLEKLQIWIDYLEEVLKCIPLFDFKWAKYKTSIAEINYADIDQDVKSTPDDNATKC